MNGYRSNRNGYRGNRNGYRGNRNNRDNRNNRNVKTDFGIISNKKFQQKTDREDRHRQQILNHRFSLSLYVYNRK